MARSEDLQMIPRSEFIIRWNIKKFSMFGAKEDNQLVSNTVVIPSLDNSEWYLKLLSKGSQETSIMFFLCRTDNGPDTIKIFYSISVDSSYAVEFQVFAKNSSSIMPGVINQEKFISKVSHDVSEDVLHIECCLWPCINVAQILNALISPYPVYFSTSTEIVVEDRSFFYKFKNFSNLPQNNIMSISLPSAGNGGIKLVFRLWVDGENLKVILREQEGFEQSQLFVLKCKIQFLDIFRKQHLVYSGRAVFNSNRNGSDRTWNFDLKLSRRELIEKEHLYLPDDVLLMHCEIDVSGKSSVNLIESTRYDTSEAEIRSRNFRWGAYLDHKYNEHRVLFRILAILVVVLSFIPHLFFDNML